jgi:hypothetical protein
VRIGAYDQDGRNGVNAADQALFMATLFAGPAGVADPGAVDGPFWVDSFEPLWCLLDHCWLGLE